MGVERSQHVQFKLGGDGLGPPRGDDRPAAAARGPLLNDGHASRGDDVEGQFLEVEGVTPGERNDEGDKRRVSVGSGNVDEGPFAAASSKSTSMEMSAGFSPTALLVTTV